MFRADSLLSYLLIALSVAGAIGSPVASAEPGIVSLPVKAPASIAERVKRDAARRTASSADSEGSLSRRTNIPPSTIPNLTNDMLGYTAQVGIGSPATEYTLLIDLSHPNTWVGAGKTYQRTSTSQSTGKTVSVTYTEGSFTGNVFTDSVYLSPSAWVTGQLVDDAARSSGFDGFDGVLGLAPEQGNTENIDGDPIPNLPPPVPTVVDNLYAQGKISSKEIGLTFLPSYSDQAEYDSGHATYGVLTFGGVDSTQYTGSIDYATKVPLPPWDKAWAVYTTIFYGGVEVASELETTIDSLSPYIFLESGAYGAYVQSTGATLDDATGLLKIPRSAASNLQNLDFQWGPDGGTYTMIPDAQIWPSYANAEIGGDSDHFYLLIQNGHGTASLGIPFLQRFYLALDLDNWKVGIATTSYTETVVTYWNQDTF